jgi:hypothetical protein
MQLHPAQPEEAVKHSVTSLAAGYIGLDFGEDVGDLLRLKKADLPEGYQDYWDFAHTMKPGDQVLIIAHHFPFALARVAGPYNYISRSLPHIGVWFRHFRQVDSISYFADFLTNAHDWPALKMTDAISPLYDHDSKSYQLIEEWLGAA